MTDRPTVSSDHQPARRSSFLTRHRFLILIVATILVALTLVVVAMSIYNASGAAQLDLSRPGYRSVSSQTDDGKTTIKDYSATGPVNSSSIDEFKKLFDAQAAKAKAVDAFGGDPLSAETLFTDTPATPPTN